MKLIGLSMGAGFVVLYFMDTAFKLDFFNGEMLIHSGFRFFTGFILLGIGVFYEHMLKLKSAMIMVLVIVLADDIWDYFRNVDSFNFEVMIHSIFIMMWGALIGYLVMRTAKEKFN
ncbi:MAG: hypothetical protein HOP23_16555 [Methylococcaceae bacterium]|nr:hypothetical protein [Methylococcaceae bacterium]